MELLAPAGNLLKMETAFAFGADAVYLGIPDFSLRVRINDFDLEKLAQGIKYAHRLKKKVYVTTNIFAHNPHLDKLEKYIERLKTMKVDAFIVADPGVISLIKKVWPRAVIHLSTQANCTNWQSAQFWYEQGIKRVVLGREVTLREIKEIKKRVPKLELEYFAHGAMCMAYSGRCFLSKLMVDRSANLGDCVQPCRWEYSIKANNHEQELIMGEDQNGTYIMNSKDLNLLMHLAELKKAGITSFKIEGRAKSVYYLATVVGIYRSALDLLASRRQDKNKQLKIWAKDLETKLVHRGYTTGFLLGEKADQNLHESHSASNWEFCGQAWEDNVIKVHNTLKVGDSIEIVRPYYDIIKMKLKKMKDLKSGDYIVEAHGGGDLMVEIEGSNIPRYSIIRRQIK